MGEVCRKEESHYEPMYTKCQVCHLFVEPNAAAEQEEGLAKWVHLHRGTPEDEALDGTHDAVPSGWSANLNWWRVHGPYAMLARFIVAEKEKEES